MKTDSLILFDGYCNLCSGTVRFILKNERGDHLRFASLQSEVGEQIVTEFSIDPAVTDSVVFVSGNKAYTKSKAAMKIAQHLRWPYRIFSFFGFIPVPLADWIYDIVASNRYRVFGKKSECWIPDARWRQKFL